jgi:hypothetical protein
MPIINSGYKPKKATVSDTVLMSALTERSTPTTVTETFLKQFQVLDKGLYRIKYEIASLNGTGVNGIISIYANGTLVNTQTRNITDYYATSFDLTVEMPVGGLINIYGYGATSAQGVKIRNCTLCCTLTGISNRVILD